MIVTKTTRKVPFFLPKKVYTPVIRSGKPWVKDEYGGLVEVLRLKECGVSFKEDIFENGVYKSSSLGF